MERVAAKMSFKDLPYDKALDLIKNCKDIKEAIMLLSGEHLKLAYNIASSLKKKYDEFYWDDIEGSALLGLTKAASNYNIENEAKFSTYASICIQNEILMYLRKVKIYNENIEKNLEEILTIDKNGSELLFEEILGDNDNNYEDFIAKDLWDNFRKEVILKDAEEEYLELRLKYGPDLTHQQIADIKGCSRSYISRTDQNLKLKIKEYFNGGITEKMSKNTKLAITNYLNYLEKDYKNFKDLSKSEIIKKVRTKFGMECDYRTISTYVYEWFRNNEKNENEKSAIVSTKECNFNIGENGIGIEVPPIPTSWDPYEPKTIEEHPIIESIETDDTVLKAKTVEENTKNNPKTIEEIEDNLLFDTITGRSKRGTFFITEDEVIQFLKLGDENPNIRFESMEDLDKFYYEMKKLLEIKEKIFGKNKED